MRYLKILFLIFSLTNIKSQEFKTVKYYENRKRSNFESVWYMRSRLKVINDSIWRIDEISDSIRYMTGDKRKVLFKSEKYCYKFPEFDKEFVDLGDSIVFYPIYFHFGKPTKVEDHFNYKSLLMYSIYGDSFPVYIFDNVFYGLDRGVRMWINPDYGILAKKSLDWNNYVTKISEDSVELMLINKLKDDLNNNIESPCDTQRMKVDVEEIIANDVEVENKVMLLDKALKVLLYDSVYKNWYNENDFPDGKLIIEDNSSEIIMDYLYLYFNNDGSKRSTLRYYEFEFDDLGVESQFIITEFKEEYDNVYSLRLENRLKKETYDFTLNMFWNNPEIESFDVITKK